MRLIKGYTAPGYDGNVRVAREFQHAQGVSYFFVTPHIAADHGDAESFHVRGLQEHEDGLLVGGGGAARVLVNDYFSLRLRASREREKENQRGGDNGPKSHVSEKLLCDAADGRLPPIGRAIITSHWPPVLRRESGATSSQ